MPGGPVGYPIWPAGCLDLTPDIFIVTGDNICIAQNKVLRTSSWVHWIIGSTLGSWPHCVDCDGGGVTQDWYITILSLCSQYLILQNHVLHQLNHLHIWLVSPQRRCVYICLWTGSHGNCPSYHIDGLVQDCSISNALAMEILQSCTKPSICKSHLMQFSPINSLAPGRSEYNSENVIFNLGLLTGIFRSSYDNALQWMPQVLTDDKSTLVPVMAWCRQATSHYLSQCWLSSLSPYGVARPQCVKFLHCQFYKILPIEPPLIVPPQLPWRVSWAQRIISAPPLLCVMSW